MKLFIAKIVYFASYRNATEVIEAAKLSNLSISTLYDRVESIDTSIEEYRMNQRTTIFAQNAFSPKTGYPINRNVLENCKK